MISVVKHDGTTEPLIIDKATRSLEWAIGTLSGVSLSEIEIQSKLHFFDGIHTSYITDIFIKTCDDLADLRHPNYDAVARNLKLQRLYKHVFKSITPPSLLDFLTTRVSAGHYSANVLNQSGVDYFALQQAIDHARDFNFTSSGLDALVNGYGVCKYETPQFIFMAIAIDIFRDYHLDRTQYIIDFYNALSNFDITLPSPEMKALRTDSTDYASCIIFRKGDSINSWKTASNALVDHTCASAGVGVDIADISSLGDKVKNGKIIHSGKLKVLKSIDTDIGKASQNGRRGSATAFVNLFDPEIESIFALKSPRMPVEDRINDLSYGIKLNQLFYDRVKSNGMISLFSVRAAPKLLELFYSDDVAAFTEYYEQLEADGLFTSQIPAQDYVTRLIAVESSETSAYYILNIDEANSNSHIRRPITLANICVEYLSGVLPLDMNFPNRPDVGVCVLGNANQGTVGINRLKHITNLLVRAQSHIMLRQNHPTGQANAYVAMYRDIGIGFSNHAFWLADNGFRYGQPKALAAHNEWMEHFSYGCHWASMELAKELGAAPGFEYHDKLLPINRYKRTVDELVDPTLHCDWALLDSLIQQHKMFNVGLMMVPPAETSAGPSNQTTSLEPIRNLLTIKDKSGVNYKQFAPDCIRLADKYDFAYDRDINADFLKHVAVTQKWIDKSISANTFYNPEWNNGKVLASSIISDLFVAKYYGVKTRYYQNTKLPDEQELAPQCAGGGCSV
jgi:ribonucleoside-diphosphate reductase alpha chain